MVGGRVTSNGYTCRSQVSSWCPLRCLSYSICLFTQNVQAVTRSAGWHPRHMHGAEHKGERGQQRFLCLHSHFPIVGQRAQFTTQVIKRGWLSITSVPSDPCPVVNLPQAVMVVSEVRTRPRGCVTQFSDTYVLPKIFKNTTNQPTKKTPTLQLARLCL